MQKIPKTNRMHLSDLDFPISLTICFLCGLSGVFSSHNEILYTLALKISYGKFSILQCIMVHVSVGVLFLIFPPLAETYMARRASISRNDASICCRLLIDLTTFSSSFFFSH